MAEPTTDTSRRAEQLAHQIEQLEERMYEAYARLGVRRTPMPPVRDEDPESLELHLQWIEKELRGLDRALAAQKQQPRPSFRERLRQLHPARLTAKAALLGLAEPSNPTDAFGRDHAVYERLRPWIRFLFEEYWRVEVEGLEHIPSRGPALLISNHGGLLPFDALMIRYAVEELHPAGREPRFLIEDWFIKLPIMSMLLTKLGALRGSPQNARRLLGEGALVGLFPEGAKGVTKAFRDRYRVQRFGRGGTIRLALETRVPIVPVSVVGSEEIYPLLAKPKLFRTGDNLNFLPVTPTFPWLGPLGFVPLPSKWMIRFGEPLDLTEFPPEVADDDITVNTLNEELRGRIQESVNYLLQRRRSPWLG